MFGVPQRIKAFCRGGQYHQIDVEDDVTIYAEYDNGMNAVFVTSTGIYPGTNRLEVNGTKGKAVIEKGQLTLELLQTDEREICYQSKSGMPKENITCEVISQEKQVQGHIKILENFTNAILYQEPLIAPGEDGINSLSIANASYLSQWKDDWVTLPVNADEYLSMLHMKQQKEDQFKRKDTVTEIKGEYSDRWNVRW